MAVVGYVIVEQGARLLPAPSSHLPEPTVRKTSKILVALSLAGQVKAHKFDCGTSNHNVSHMRNLRWSSSAVKMAEEINSSASASTTAAAAATTATTTGRSSRSLWPSLLRWIPTSTDHIIAAEKRLLSLVKYDFFFLITCHHIGNDIFVLPLCLIIRTLGLFWIFSFFLTISVGTCVCSDYDSNFGSRSVFIEPGNSCIELRGLIVQLFYGKLNNLSDV